MRVAVVDVIVRGEDEVGPRHILREEVVGNHADEALRVVRGTAMIRIDVDNRVLALEGVARSAEPPQTQPALDLGRLKGRDDIVTILHYLSCLHYGAVG